MVSPDRVRMMTEAIAAGDCRKVNLLLKAGVPVNGATERGVSFLELAAWASSDEVFDLLIERGAKLAKSGMLAAAVDGDGGACRCSMKIVRHILESGKYTKSELDDSLRFASAGQTPEVVQELLQRGADVNGREREHKRFPLANAVENGNVEIAQILLRHGADKSMQVFSQDETGKWMKSGQSLNDIAIQSGCSEMVQLLQ